jgi:hypothetical protein
MIQTRLKSNILIVNPSSARRHILFTGCCSFGMAYASNLQLLLARNTTFRCQREEQCAVASY